MNGAAGAIHGRCAAIDPSGARIRDPLVRRKGSRFVSRRVPRRVQFSLRWPRLAVAPSRSARARTHGNRSHSQSAPAKGGETLERSRRPCASSERGSRRSGRSSALAWHAGVSGQGACFASDVTRATSEHALPPSHRTRSASHQSSVRSHRPRTQMRCDRRTPRRSIARRRSSIVRVDRQRRAPSVNEGCRRSFPVCAASTLTVCSCPASRADCVDWPVGGPPPPSRGA